MEEWAQNWFEFHILINKIANQMIEVISIFEKSIWFFRQFSEVRNK